MNKWLFASMLILCVGACEHEDSQDASRGLDMDAAAHEYLFLELSMGQHDPMHVDAYYGPEEIRAEAVAAGLGLEAIRTRSAALAETLRAARDAADASGRQRIDGLLARLRALATRIDIARGDFLPFDEEAQRLFGVRPPEFGEDEFRAILTEIDELLPGDDKLAKRVDDYRKRFEIPADKLELVLDAAIVECRRRTLQHIELPADESFTVAFVTDKPWGGYNWYQGNATSLIEINTDLPTEINRAVGLGCHEIYPGHHTYNALLETELVQARGWIEYSLYPLFSPESLIAEGTANYGRRLVFPGDERAAFETAVLFPLAGLDAGEASRYYRLLELLTKLAYVRNEAARDYLNGDRSRDATIDWLVEYSLVSPQRAEKSVDFMDAYRSYVINYNFGQDLVRQYVERDDADEDSRWQRFKGLLSSPVRTEDLL